MGVFSIKLTLCYFCKKCGKSYSHTDFELNDHCRDCGEILLKKYTIDSPRIRPRKSEELENAAKSFRRRSEDAKEYQVLPESSALLPCRGASADGWILGCEMDDALRLRADLMVKFEGKALFDSVPGEVLSNEHGDCYLVRQRHRFAFKRPTAEECRRRIVSDLKLLPGIGPTRERSLKQQGYHTIEELAGNLKWRKSALEFLSLTNSKDVLALQKLLRRTLPKSHPLAHYLAGFCRDRDLAVIDIETLGLFGRPIILVGLAEITKRELWTSQFLARDVSEEAAVIWELTHRLCSGSVFVSFNGRCFDVPFILERMAYYNLDSEEVMEIPHFDMLHFARRSLKDKIASFRLESLEKYLGINRSVNVPGALVPEFYDSYQRSGNVGPLIAILEHNKQDLVTLTRLFCCLYQEWGQ